MQLSASSYYAALCFKFPTTMSHKWVGHHPPQDFGTVVVVLHGVLHKTEAVHVADVGMAVGSQQIESAHGLL